MSDVKTCNKMARKKVREKENWSMPASPKEQKKKERKEKFKLNCTQVKTSEPYEENVV